MALDGLALTLLSDNVRFQFCRKLNCFRAVGGFTTYRPSVICVDEDFSQGLADGFIIVGNQNSWHFTTLLVAENVTKLPTESLI